MHNLLEVLLCNGHALVPEAGHVDGDAVPGRGPVVAGDAQRPQRQPASAHQQDLALAWGRARGAGWISYMIANEVLNLSTQ